LNPDQAQLTGPKVPTSSAGPAVPQPALSHDAKAWVVTAVTVSASMPSLADPFS
jgi:hypothetical protein